MRVLCCGLFFFLGFAFRVNAATESYQGLGKESLSLETLQKFSPASLPVEISRNIQSYLDIRSPGLGLLHPNQKDLFFSWRVTGVSQVWKTSKSQAFPVQMTGGEDATSLAGITPDGKYLILSRDRAGEENPGLYLQKVSGGPLELIQHKPKVQTLFEFASKDSTWIYYRANDQAADSYAIYRYHIKNHKTEMLVNLKGYWTVLDHQEDGRLLLYKAVTSLAGEIYEWSPKSPELKALLGQGEKEEFDARYGPSEGQYFVLTNKFSDFRELFLYSPSLKKQNWKKIPSPSAGDISEFKIDLPRKHLVYRINHEGYSKIFALDPRSLREIRLPEFPDADQVELGSFDWTGAFLMMGVETAFSPKMSYSYHWKTGKLNQWVVPSTPEVDVSQFVRAKLEYYTSRDGHQIPMFVYRSKLCEKQLCPVVVNFHGGPEGQSRAGFRVLAQIFAQRGFVFVEPNVRGSDGYGKTWINSDNGSKRLSVVTDIPDAALWIREHWSKAGVRPKMGVMGWSYGGYSTQVAMTKFAGSFDVGVALVGMSNLKTFLLNTAPYRRALRISEYGDPVADAAALDELSPMTYVDSVTGPLLLIQGASDPRVPAGEAVQIYDRLKAKKTEVGLILFGDEGHGSQKRSNQVLELGHTLLFFEKYLK